MNLSPYILRKFNSSNQKENKENLQLNPQVSQEQSKLRSHLRHSHTLYHTNLFPIAANDPATALMDCSPERLDTALHST